MIENFRLPSPTQAAGSLSLPCVQSDNDIRDNKVALLITVTFIIGSKFANNSMKSNDC